MSDRRAAQAEAPVDGLVTAQIQRGEQHIARTPAGRTEGCFRRPDHAEEGAQALRRRPARSTLVSTDSRNTSGRAARALKGRAVVMTVLTGNPY